MKALFRFIQGAGVAAICCSACGGTPGEEVDEAISAIALHPHADVPSSCVHASALGVDYQVGPAQPYANLNDVPWETLGPGDSVRVHWRAAPYREKVLLSNQGTASDPIVVCGVADGPNGEMPVIDGRGATTRPQTKYGPSPGQNANVEGCGVITVFPGVHWYQQKPKYIVIAGLVIQGARTDPDVTHADFFDENGAGRKYALYNGKSGASSVYIWGSESITVRDDVLTDSGNGLMVISQGVEKTQSRHILVRGNEFHGNGSPGSFGTHQAYTEAIDIVYEYNHFGRLAPGAAGDEIKDRSAGTVIRYNWIESGNFMVNLVDAAESQPVAGVDPSYADTWVYGNVMLDRPVVDPALFPAGVGFRDAKGDYWSNAFSQYLVHYGGDLSKFAGYRKGTLHFYANTVVLQGDSGKQPPASLFDVDADPAAPAQAGTVVMRNNIVWRGPLTEGAKPIKVVVPFSGNLVATLGRYELGPNWFSGDPAPISLAPLKYPFALPGAVSGQNQILWGNLANDPGFVARSADDFHPLAAAPVVDQGGPLDPAAAAAYPVTVEYLQPLSGAPRAVNGAAPDLGAFEAP